MAFEIYKRGQGRYTRPVTFAAAMLLGVLGAYVLSENLGAFLPRTIAGRHVKIYLQYGIPTVLVAGLAWGMFRLVNRQKTADFLIATEGEMKKVAWSSRKEVIGSTKVVIVTAFMIAAILFAVDMLFIFLFREIGILHLPS